MQVFDPSSSSISTLLLKQSDHELTSEERTLKGCLQKYQQSFDDASDAETSWTHDQEQALEQLQKSYEKLEYWEEVLDLEKMKYGYVLKEKQEANDDDNGLNDIIADSLHQQGKYHLRLADFVQSKQYYDQSLEYFQSYSTNEVQEGHVLISLAGWHFFRNNDLTKAMELLKEAEILVKTNPTLLYKCFDNQGLIYRLEEKFEEALGVYQQALQLCTTDNENRDEGQQEQKYAIQMHIGDMLLALGRYQEAVEVYQMLLDQPNILTNFGRQGVIWHQIAICHESQNYIEMALTEYQHALQFKIQGAGGETNPEVAKTYCAIGLLQASDLINQKHLALDSFHKVLAIARMHASEDDGGEPKDPNVLRAIQMIAKLEKELQM